MTTDLQTPLPSHDLGPLRVPSNPLRAAGRKVEDDSRPALTRQGSMDFLSLLPNGSKATGKIISLSAKLQSNTTRSSNQPSLSASSSSSSNLFALHNQPAYKPSHSTSFPAFQGDYVMSAPSPLEVAPPAGGAGGGRKLELGAEIPSRKTRTYNPPPVPQMSPSALRTSTTSSTSLSSNVTTITTTTTVSCSGSSSSMGPPSSTASVSSTRRTSLRPSTMLKRSTSSAGNVNPYVRAAVLSSSASLSSLAQNPTPNPIPESSSTTSSTHEPPATRLIKPLKPRLSRSISHASSLSLNLVSSPPKPTPNSTITPNPTPNSAYVSSSSSTSSTPYSDGSISPTTLVAPLPNPPSSSLPSGPILVAGGGERKRTRLSFQPPAPLSIPLPPRVGGWGSAAKNNELENGLGSPFLEMGGGVGMFGGMMMQEEGERKPWEDDGEGKMEVDEK
ncbi:hypothetical protein BDY24DRAFT_432638 [Mrakia frigida]|uniref:uncharacterized protein n=1 Tax=Mrakia frigida TaxID=29902 RepID=UPI003FCBFE86